MAKIIDNRAGRRSIRLNTDDIISIVREYQNITVNTFSYNDIRNRLNNFEIYIPEDLD